MPPTEPVQQRVCLSDRSKIQKSEEAYVAGLVNLSWLQAEGEPVSGDLSPSSSLWSLSWGGGAAFLRGARLGVAFLGVADSLVPRRFAC